MRKQAIGVFGSALRAAAVETSPKLSNSGSASVLISRGFADDASLMKTELYDYHVAHGGEAPGAHPA